MFKKEMKSLIIFAISKDIESLETKKGYNGAPILRLASENRDDIDALIQWCRNLGYSTNLKDNSDTPAVLRSVAAYTLFCVFGEDETNEDVFELKDN